MPIGSSTSVRNPCSSSAELPEPKPIKTSALLVTMLLSLLPAHAAAPVPKEKTELARDIVLPEPDYLPPLARRLLRKRMERHGRDQSRLVLAVTLLQRDVVKSIAGDIAAEPRIVRPLAEGRDDLNAALPERFFVLEDALRLRAKELVAAVANKDDVGLAKSFGQMVEICVSCHSVYLDPELPR